MEASLLVGLKGGGHDGVDAGRQAVSARHLPHVDVLRTARHRVVLSKVLLVQRAPRLRVNLGSKVSGFWHWSKFRCPIFFKIHIPSIPGVKARKFLSSYLISQAISATHSPIFLNIVWLPLVSFSFAFFLFVGTIETKSNSLYYQYALCGFQFTQSELPEVGSI